MMGNKRIPPFTAVLIFLLIVASLGFIALGVRTLKMETNHSNFVEDLSEQVANMSEQITILEEKIKGLESNPKGNILFQNILRFEGNKTIVFSLEENETITFSIIAKEGSLNFTFGLLREERFDKINYVTNLIPEYQIVFNEEDLITQISFEYTTYLEGLYGFSMESSNLVILDVCLSKK